jgi:hypothetical protein
MARSRGAPVARSALTGCRPCPGGAQQRAADLVRAIAQIQCAKCVDIDQETALFEAEHLGQPGTVAAVTSASHGDSETVIVSAPASDTVARAPQAYANRPTIYGADALGWALYAIGLAIAT